MNMVSLQTHNNNGNIDRYCISTIKIFNVHNIIKNLSINLCIFFVRESLKQFGVLVVVG